MKHCLSFFRSCNNRRNSISLFIPAVLLSLGSFLTLPANDDWNYLSSPQFTFDASKFLPDNHFWRPIDYAIGLFNGKFPSLFPFINHLFVICAYLYSWWMLKKILQQFNNRGAFFIAMALFTVSPALVASVYSVDSINQSLSLAFGVASVSFFKRNTVFSYVFMTLSLFSKECGIAWFGITPLLCLALDNEGEILKSFKRIARALLKPYLIAAIIIVVYFALRIALTTNAGDGDGSRYDSGIGLQSLSGFALLVGISLSCIDTISLAIERNWPVIATTTIISTMFVVFILQHTWKSIKDAKTILLWIAVFASCVPYIMMEHPGEMHAMNTLWLIALCIGITVPGNHSPKEKAVVATFLIASLFVYIHKTCYIIDTGLHSQNRTMSAVNSTTTVPDSVVILDCNTDGRLYSVFRLSSAKLWDYGRSTRLYFRNNKPAYTEYKQVGQGNLQLSIDSIKTNPFKHYDCIWILQGDDVTILPSK